MLYHLFKYFDNVHNLPGAGMFQYISFRAAAAIIIALLIVIVFGRNIINFLRRKQIGEEIRDLGLEGQLQKKGTPTMGGVIILLAILIPVLLFGQLDNVYIQLMLVSTIWLGLIGFLAGVSFQKGLLRAGRAPLAIFGAVSVVLVYGGIMNPASAILYQPNLSLSVLKAYYLTGFPFDLVHAAATALFLWFGAEPMLEKLERVKRKYGLTEAE